MRPNQGKNKETIPQIYIPPMPPQKPILPYNIGTATFSHVSKQAESLVNGDISIAFNNFNNNVLFRSKSVDINDCVNIDVIHKKLQNMSGISFDNKSEIKGISDGYTTNKQGAKVPLYDKNIALSTVFAYEYEHQIDLMRQDLNTEIEKRKYGDELLNQRVSVIEAEDERLEDDVNALKILVSTYESRIKTLETNLATAENNIKTLNSTISAQQTKITKLEALTKHFVDI